MKELCSRRLLAMGTSALASPVSVLVLISRRERSSAPPSKKRSELLSVLSTRPIVGSETPIQLLRFMWTCPFATLLRTRALRASRQP
jgi:hypothetical protein